MPRFTRALLVTTVIAGAALTSVTDAQAGCGGSRRSIISHIRQRVAYVPRPVYYPPAPAPCTQPVVAQPIAPPIGQPGAPSVRQPFQQSPAQPTKPGQQQAQVPNPAASQGTQAQVGTAAPTNNAQLTALQALAGMSASQTPASPAPVQPQRNSQAGTWTAQLANGARVRLQLQTDSTFSWSATNKAGNTSAFSGSYTVSGGVLTLIRSNDNQKLAGAMTQSGANTFNFKLAGAKDAGLNFVRS